MSGICYRGSVVVTRSRNGGFSLLEVLIAIVIFSIGLLGLAALQGFSVKSNQSANFRTQATSLAYMMIDRMRANQGVVLQGAYLADFAAGSCPTPPPVAPPTAAHDIAAWRQQIDCQLPDGQGEIRFPGGGNVIVSIKWTDARWSLIASERTPTFELVTRL